MLCFTYQVLPVQPFIHADFLEPQWCLAMQTHPRVANEIKAIPAPLECPMKRLPNEHTFSEPHAG